MKAEGKVFVFGDNIDTDIIIPAVYLTTFDPEQLKKYCMEPVDSSFCDKVNDGDIIVAGKNFGCGSSREHAPIAIKATGISCVIAESFARIFYRNAINIGLPIVESKEASQAIKEGHNISIDFKNGIISNSTTKETYEIAPFPPFIQNIINAGGLMESIRDRGV